MDDLIVIAGLGNPGRKFENTRHNVGFDTVDLLAWRHGIKITKLKCKALVGEGIIENRRVLLVKPQTFMNSSGESIREIIEYYKVPVKNIIVIYDDVDLKPGKLRIRPKGSSGTHNGMKSVIYQIQSDEFPRVRIGIGPKPDGWDLADYVLSRFKPEEREIVNKTITRAADAIEEMLRNGLEAAMNIYNRDLAENPDSCKMTENNESMGE